MKRSALKSLAVLAALEEGELYLLSKADGVIRKIVSARPTSGAVKK